MYMEVYFLNDQIISYKLQYCTLHSFSTKLQDIVSEPNTLVLRISDLTSFLAYQFSMSLAPFSQGITSRE